VWAGNYSAIRWLVCSLWQDQAACIDRQQGEAQRIQARVAAQLGEGSHDLLKAPFYSRISMGCYKHPRRG
jgi:hypothetical protein